MPVYLDLATRMDAKSAEDAAKLVTAKFVEAAKEINGTVGGILGKMFDEIDGTKGRNELKSMQEEYAKLARVAGDAERAQVAAAGNARVAIMQLSEAHDKKTISASRMEAAEQRVVNTLAMSEQAATNAAAATDAAAAAHTRMGNAAEGTNAKMLLAAGGMAAVVAGAVEVTKKLFDMGEMWANVSDRITATTGKIGADAEAMTDQVAKIADQTAAPIESIAQVYAQLTRLKELQGSTLNDLTQQISEFNQRSGESLNIGMFTRTMQEFHVPADQMGKDLNTLHSAAQDGQVPLNELIQTMHTAGPAADIAGLSFSQMAHVLAALDESGVNVDTSLKAIRMSLGLIAADAPNLAKRIKFAPDENELQRLKDVIQKIQELKASGDNIGALDLGKAAFGRSWADIGQAILDDKLNVDTLNTAIGNAGSTIQEQFDATKHWGDAWTELKNRITDALKPLSGDVFKSLDEGLSQLSDWVTAHGDGVNRFFSDLADTLAAINPLTWIANIPGFLPDPTDPNDDSGAGHTGASGRDHRNRPSADSPTGGQPQNSTTTATPTTPNINTVKPYHPLDLNPADKPPGAETYDEWINSQKAVQSALDHQADTGERLAAAQQRQKELLDSGTATQDQLNSISDEIATAEREKLQSDQDVTVANQKYVEDANKTKKGKGDKWDNYDPFTEATKNANGLIPQLAGLATAFVTNLALGNPFGKLQAAKRGEDPTNPLYVADVNGGGTGADGNDPGGGGLAGALRRYFDPGSTGQPSTAPGGGQSPAGSIPTIAAPNGTGQPSASAPSGAVQSAVPGDSPLVAALKSNGSFSPAQIRLIQGFSNVEGLNPAGNPTLGYSDAKLGGDSSLQGHVTALAQQFKDRSPVAGPFPEGGSDQQQAQWIAKVVGQPLTGINPPDTGDYVGKIVSNLKDASPATGAPAAGAPGGGVNLSTIPVAVQKYANDCIDASARIILSHSGVNMTEDQLEGVIPPGGSIDSQAAGMNKLDPQGGFKAMQGSGGSQQVMFNAIKASIDNGTGSILNVAPGSSLAGHTFAPGHFIAVTGYNPDGTINVSDTAGGRSYAVSAEDAFQATQGRGIVAGTGTGPQSSLGATTSGTGQATNAGQSGPAQRPTLPGILGSIFNGAPWQGFATGGTTIGAAAGHPIAASDTVPAMLTPGEFVVKKDVAQKNMPALQALNTDDPHAPSASHAPPSTASGLKSGSRKDSDSSSVTPPPPGPRIGQGTGSGFGIGGGLIGMAESAAMMAAAGAAGFGIGGTVPDVTGAVGASAGANAGAKANVAAQAAPGGGGGGSGGGPSGGSGDPMTAVLNRTVGYIGQLGGIAAQGLMSSLIPGASQKGGIMDGGILSKLAGGIAGAHPSAPNTAGNTATPLAPPAAPGGDGAGTTNHIGTQAGVYIGNLSVPSGDDGKKLTDHLLYQGQAGYGGR